MMIDVLGCTILGISIGLCIIMILNSIGKHQKMNINSNVVNDGKLSLPKFKVVKIEKVLADDYCTYIAKYTCTNAYMKKGKKFIMNDIIFFDKMGAWNIGDCITISKEVSKS